MRIFCCRLSSSAIQHARANVAPSHPECPATLCAAAKLHSCRTKAGASFVDVHGAAVDSQQIKRDKTRNYMRRSARISFS